MKLIRLEADNEKFNTLNFNRNGLSIIHAHQKHPDSDQKTINGVGKSLTIFLIDFCLGSNRRRNLEEALPDWEFKLTIEINGKEYVIRRSTTDQSKIYLNNEEMGVKKFGQLMSKLVFGFDETKIKHLSFRSLIHHFIRPSKACYERFDVVNNSEQNYQTLLLNSYLLGLDIKLIKEKKELRDKHTEAKKILDKLKKDEIFRKYFIGDKDPDSELLEIQDQIHSLEQELNNYEVADNYYEIQEKANSSKIYLQELRNQLVIFQNSIENIDISLQERPDISIKTIEELFDDANIHFSDNIKRSLSQITNFHKTLLENRVQRLTGEKRKLIQKISNIEKEIESKNLEFDNYIKYLSTTKALEEYAEVNHYLQDLRFQASKIQDYKGLIKEYEKQILEAKADMGQQDLIANDYLEAEEKHINKIRDTFRGLSKLFYENRPAIFNIKNNDGDNQLRFNIMTKIEGDSSDGINAVKIFCYDFTKVSLFSDPAVNFIFHDSRLLSHIDNRQRAILFRYAYDFTNTNNFQYIISINESQLQSIKNHISEEEYNKIFNQESIILTLTDESEKTKLLGIQVDLDYD